MREKAAGVCLGVLGAILWLPRLGDFSLDMAQWLGVASHLLASELSKGRQNLSLTDGRKQKLDGSSSNF